MSRDALDGIDRLALPDALTSQRNDISARFMRELHEALSAMRTPPQMVYVGEAKLAEIKVLAVDTLGVSDFLGFPVVLVPGMQGMRLVPQPESPRFMAPIPRSDLLRLYITDLRPGAMNIVPARLFDPPSRLILPLVAWATLAAFVVLQLARL